MLYILLAASAAILAKAQTCQMATTDRTCNIATPTNGAQCCQWVIAAEGEYCDNQLDPAECPTMPPTSDPSQSPTTPAPTTVDPSKSPSESPTESPTTKEPTTQEPTTQPPTTTTISTPEPTTPEPTPKPPTSSPTPAPTPSPTPSPTDNPTPQTTLEEVTTTCLCPTPAPVTPAPISKKKKKKKKKKGLGIGVGDCDCDGGVSQIRFIYQGTRLGVTFTVYSDEKKGTAVCTFHNVNPNDELVCDWDPRLGQDDFENETPFVVTYKGGGTCEAQYHTSCSSDIVGLVQPECQDIIVSGWKSLTNQDCDDGKEPCTCGVTTATPTFLTMVGTDTCYCENNMGTPSPIFWTTASKKKKKKKKKSKKGGGGVGVGDCDCDKEFGMVEMRMMYSGSTQADIEVHSAKGSGMICQINGVQPGAEAVCNSLTSGTNYQSTKGGKRFDTNSEVRVISGAGVCVTVIHTSCSSDIVGTFGDKDCGVIVSGWRDGNPNDNNNCDDGLDPCDCANPQYNKGPAAETKNMVNLGLDKCFCSDLRQKRLERALDNKVDIADQSTLLAGDATQEDASKFKNLGFMGEKRCSRCQGDYEMMRFVVHGLDTYDIELQNSNGESLCSYTGVGFGDENECEAAFDDTTLVKATDSNGNTVCDGYYVTKCGKVGTNGFSPTNQPQTTGCDFIIGSAWKGTENDETCDDGFYPCECIDCAQFGGAGNDACEENVPCKWNKQTQECFLPSAANTFKIAGLFMAVLAALLF